VEADLQATDGGGPADDGDLRTEGAGFGILLSAEMRRLTASQELRLEPGVMGAVGGWGLGFGAMGYWDVGGFMIWAENTGLGLPG